MTRPFNTTGHRTRRSRGGRVILTLSAVLVLVLAVVAAASIYTVDEAEQVIVVQFGAPVGDPITEPGLHFRVPFVQEVLRFDKRLLSWDGDPNQVPTVEEQFISVDTTARWKIVDPLKFLQSVKNEEGARNRLNDILDSVVRDKIAASPSSILCVPKTGKLPKKTCNGQWQARGKRRSC